MRSHKSSGFWGARGANLIARMKIRDRNQGPFTEMYLGLFYVLRRQTVRAMVDHTVIAKAAKQPEAISTLYIIAA